MKLGDPAMSGGKKPHSISKRPLAALLAERGIFNTEDEARHWVMSGKVLSHLHGQRNPEGKLGIALALVEGQAGWMMDGKLPPAGSSA